MSIKSIVKINEGVGVDTRPKGWIVREIYDAERKRSVVFEFGIYINDETAKEVVDFQIEYDEEENLYTFTIDIKTILPQPSGFDIIGASPATIDEYNVFTGDIVYVRIETQEI